MIGASIDMRIPNQSMRRSRCVQSPRAEDLIYHLHDYKIFTQLDLRQGYHQLGHTLGKLQTPATGVWSKIVTRCI